MADGPRPTRQGKILLTVEEDLPTVLPGTMGAGRCRPPRWERNEASVHGDRGQRGDGISRGAHAVAPTPTRRTHKGPVPRPPNSGSWATQLHGRVALLVNAFESSTHDKSITVGPRSLARCRTGAWSSPLLTIAPCRARRLPGNGRTWPRCLAPSPRSPRVASRSRASSYKSVHGAPGTWTTWRARDAAGRGRLRQSADRRARQSVGAVPAWVISSCAGSEVLVAAASCSARPPRGRGSSRRWTLRAWPNARASRSPSRAVMVDGWRACSYSSATSTSEPRRDSRRGHRRRPARTVSEAASARAQRVRCGLHRTG
jgi:hypothetical protein